MHLIISPSVWFGERALMFGTTKGSASWISLAGGVSRPSGGRISVWRKRLSGRRARDFTFPLCFPIPTRKHLLAICADWRLERWCARFAPQAVRRPSSLRSSVLVPLRGSRRSFRLTVLGMDTLTVRLRSGMLAVSVWRLACLDL